MLWGVERSRKDECCIIIKFSGMKNENMNVLRMDISEGVKILFLMNCYFFRKQMARRVERSLSLIYIFQTASVG